MGLRFAGSLTFEGWERAGEQISRIVSSSAWCLGDWIIVGQSRFSDRYKQVIEAVGLDYQTVRNYAWVARRFELSRRRDTLSFQHHAEVAALPASEQDDWLDRAEDQGWSRNRLRQELRNSRIPAAKNGVAASALPRIVVTQERITRWRATAEQMKMTLESWIVVNLDSAAELAHSGGEPEREIPGA
ncbi:MAG: LmbU [Streptosporangiales bacterium]|nr:LmbU [Streptosporangiales bacterium]